MLFLKDNINDPGPKLPYLEPKLPKIRKEKSPGPISLYTNNSFSPPEDPK